MEPEAIELKVWSAGEWYLLPITGLLTEADLAPFKEVMARYHVEPFLPDERVRIAPIRRFAKDGFLAYLKLLDISLSRK